MNVAMPKFKQMQTLVDRLNLVSREILTGIMPIRAFSREAFEEKRFDRANTDLMRTQLFTNRTMVAMMPFMTLIMNGTSLLIVWFGGKAMDMGTMQVGEMIAFITYTMQIVMSFLMLSMVAVMLPRAGVAADRIDEVVTTRATIHDPLPQAPAGERYRGRGGVLTSASAIPAPRRTHLSISALRPAPAKRPPSSARPAAVSQRCST